MVDSFMNRANGSVCCLLVAYINITSCSERLITDMEEVGTEPMANALACYLVVPH
jgi:hypothetical protein